MIYLIIGLVCSASISIILKVGESKTYNRYGMLTFNYLTCVIVGFLFLSQKTIPAGEIGFSFAVILSVLNGLLYLGSMAMNQINVKRNGAILQSTFARLGVMIPTILSILLFGERPSVLQILGIVLVVCAILLMNYGNKKDSEAAEKSDTAGAAKPAIILLVAGLLFGGAADFTSKIFEQFGSRNMDDWFVMLTFFCAMIISIIICIVKKVPIGKREIILGILLGIPNYLSTRFLLKALTSVSAYIAYPTYSVGAILVVILISGMFFGEKLNKWSKFGVGLIIGAIILLNV